MKNAPRARVARRPVHGVLLLDKPLGWSSNDALQKVKWLLRAEKAGHTGTLDPLATGVLPLCFGAATKFSQLHLEAHKSYTATVCLGVQTTTGDAEGEVIARQPVQVDAAKLAEVIAQFRGTIAQIPPMYSALKKDGKALYEYARAGQEVAREARQVEITKLEAHLLPNAENQADTPMFEMQVTCSKGTYIRTLGEDIGAALGCGAHLTALRRSATGNLEISQCITLDALEAMNEAQRWACLQPVEVLLAEHVTVVLDEENAGRFLSGVRRRGSWPDASQVAVFAANPRALLGVGHIKAGELIPGRLLSPLEIQQILESTSLNQAQERCGGGTEEN